MSANEILPCCFCFSCFICLFPFWNMTTCLIQLYEYSITYLSSKMKYALSIQAEAFFRGILFRRSECFQQLNQVDRLETLHMDVICDVSMFFCFAFDAFVIFPCQIKQLPYSCQIFILRQTSLPSIEQQAQCSLEKFVISYAVHFQVGGIWSALHGLLD